MPIVNVSLERSNFICKALAAQKTRPAIIKELMAKFKVSTRTAYDYVEIVNMKLAKEGEQEKPYRKQWIRQSFQRVYRLAIEQHNLQAAVMALDRLAKLDGLYEPEVVKIQPNNDPDGSVLHMTTGEARAELQSLMEERARMLGPVKKTNGRSNGKTH